MMEDSYIKTNKSIASADEVRLREKLLKLFKESPIPEEELLHQITLFLRRHQLQRILFMNELYQKILDVHGIIVEFGVRWGRNLALFESLRAIYEPWNIRRKIVGFDSFEGFPKVNPKDGKEAEISIGNYSVTKGYEHYLEEILDCHEALNPMPTLKKYEIIKGDAVVEVENYFLDHPESIVALAYFDFDIYEPTKKCLEVIIKGHITKGTVIGFDEVGVPEFPGETIALKDVLGLDRYRIMRTPYSLEQSYIVIE